MNQIKVPLYPATMALYKTLKAGEACGLTWYEGDTDIDEIDANFRDQAAFGYGILGAVDADQNDKVNTIWDYSIQLEIFSSYPGRKIVAEKLNELMNFMCQGTTWSSLEKLLAPEGFTIISMNIGPHRLNPAIRGDNGTWQSGSVNLVMKLNQI